MKKLTLLLTLLIPVFSFSQITFDNTYGGVFNDYATKVRQTYDDSYIIVGSTEDTLLKVYLIKTNGNGDTLWTKRFGENPSMEGSSWEGYDVKQTTDSGFIITGERSESTGGSTAYLARTDRFGNLLWSSNYGYVQGDTVYNFCSGREGHQTSDSGFIIVGYADHMVWDNGGIYLIKTDADGNVNWQNICKGSLGINSSGSAIHEADDGGYLVGGKTQYFFGSPFHALLIRTNELGDTIWTKIVGDSYSGVSNIQKIDSNKYLIGISGGGIFNQTLFSELLIVDIDGNVLWSKRFNFGSARGTDMHQTTDGNFIICGEVFDEQLYTNMFLFKADSTGDSIWFNEFGGTQNDMCASVQNTNDGGYIMAGFTYSYGSGGEDVYVVKTNGDGIMTWSREYRIEKEIKANLYPNPLSTSTTIEYELQSPQTVTITFYNQFGKQVDRMEQKQSAGKQQVVWAPVLPGGVYYFRMEAGDQMASGKVVLVR